MTYSEAMAEIGRWGAQEADRDRALRRAYADLGLSPGTDVKLPGTPGSRRTSAQRDDMRIVELRRPWVALVYRDEGVYAVCGESESDVVDGVPPARQGPNGPIDSVRWLRTGGVS